MGKRTSPIWNINKEILIKIVKESTSITQILRYFNFNNKGSNHKTLYSRLKEDGIDYSHIKLGIGFNKGRKFIRDKIPLEKILIEASNYDRSRLKKRLFEENLLKNQCSECGLGTEWNNKKISLQIDHINGIANDNRIENLRILCPNCHSQTDNFAGKKNKKFKIKKEKIYKRKVEWPSKEELEKLLFKFPATKIAKIYNVSDKSIAKWANKYGLKKPGRGYWMKNIGV